MGLLPCSIYCRRKRQQENRGLASRISQRRLLVVTGRGRKHLSVTMMVNILMILVVQQNGSEMRMWNLDTMCSPRLSWRNCVERFFIRLKPKNIIFHPMHVYVANMTYNFRHLLNQWSWSSLKHVSRHILLLSFPTFPQSVMLCHTWRKRYLFSEAFCFWWFKTSRSIFHYCC